MLKCSFGSEGKRRGLEIRCTEWSYYQPWGADQASVWSKLAQWEGKGEICTRSTIDILMKSLNICWEPRLLMAKPWCGVIKWERSKTAGGMVVSNIWVFIEERFRRSLRVQWNYCNNTTVTYKPNKERLFIPAKRRVKNQTKNNQN